MALICEIALKAEMLKVDTYDSSKYSYIDLRSSIWYKDRTVIVLLWLRKIILNINM